MPISPLGIVGPGLMGLGIADVAVAHATPVLMLTRDASANAAAQERWRARLQRLLERGRIDAETLRTRMAAVQFTCHTQDLSACPAVIESVPEDRALKIGILQRLENVLQRDALIATNTSGLPITGLGEHLQRPERFIGLHFFSPVERMPLVEVVRGQRTSENTLSQALALVRACAKQPVVVRDGPGFFTSRVFAAYLDEAVAMVGEGVDPSRIEQAALTNGRAVGPLAVLDEVSLELNVQQARQARADGLPERFCRPLAEPVLARLVGQGRGGRRQGGGFYDTSSQGERSLWAGLSTLFKPVPQQPEDHVLQQRLRCIEALEALRCLQEGVIEQAEDADAASVLGLGFPASRGGVLRDVDTQGLKAFVADCQRLQRLHGARYAVSPWLQALADSGQGLYNNIERNHSWLES